MTAQQTFLTVLAAALVLSGCGKNPSAAGDYEHKIGVNPNQLKGAVATPKATAPPRASFARGEGSQTAQAFAPAPPSSTQGSLSLSVNVSGSAPVAALALTVPGLVESAVNLPVTAGVATWSQAAVGAGTFKLQLSALAANGTVLGRGATNAVVKAGEPTEVSVDLHVNAASATPTPAPVTPTAASATPPADPTPAATTAAQSVSVTAVDHAAATPVPTPSATPTPPQVGGTIGLDLEIR